MIRRRPKLASNAPLSPRITDDLSRGVGLTLLRFRAKMQAFLWVCLVGAAAVVGCVVAWAMIRAEDGQWGAAGLWATSWFINDVLQSPWGVWRIDTGGEPEKWSTYMVRTSQWHIDAFGNISDALVEGLIGGAIALPFAIGGAAWMARHAGQGARDPHHLRGRKILSEAALARLVKRSKRGGDKTLAIGRVPILKDSERQHFLFLGTTGVGKSVSIMRMADAARERRDSAVIYDVTGDYVRNFYRPEYGDVILNPLDQRSPHWSPWAEMQHDADADRLSHALVPRGEGSNQFFSDAARALLAASLLHFRSRPDRSVEGLLRFMLTATKEAKLAAFQGTEAAKYYAEGADRAGASVDMNLATYLRSMRFLPAAAGSTDDEFSITRFMTAADQPLDGRLRKYKRRPWLFLTSRERDHAAIRPLLTCFVDSAISALMGLGPREERRVWFILDELFSLHEVPNLPRALAEGRKFGLCTIVGLQNTGQLNDIYGRDQARSMLSLLNTRAAFRVGDADSAKWVSELLGQAERERTEEAARYGSADALEGMNISTRRGLENIVLPSEVMDLEDLECFLTLPGKWPVGRVKLRRPNGWERNQIHIDFAPADPALTAAARLRGTPLGATSPEVNTDGCAEIADPPPDSVSGDAAPSGTDHPVRQPAAAEEKVPVDPVDEEPPQSVPAAGPIATAPPVAGATPSGEPPQAPSPDAAELPEVPSSRRRANSAF
ncbi:type IV secretion system DNA-binding domain-containing protein [Pseudoroseomonas sp. WGS1072]|uniref:type IV secretion system DNA-binding domain-containing protein n=1 Tax=Roseomonas sp. WGS1072 TaxID=3366816 RepID=UPI003BF379AB